MPTITISKLIGARVFCLQKHDKRTARSPFSQQTNNAPARAHDVAAVSKEHPKELGRVHYAVFSADARTLLGFFVKRKDVLGMVKLRDAFVALDGIVARGNELYVKHDAMYHDAAAQKRLTSSWDTCLMLQGMDVITTNGEELGHIIDVAVDMPQGAVVELHINDGSVATAMVGHISAPQCSFVAYDNGHVVLNDAQVGRNLSGGLAGKAGVGYAKAKVEGKKLAQVVAQKIDDVAPADVRAEKVRDAGHAVGKQLGKSKRMFSSFIDEFNKASK